MDAKAQQLIKQYMKNKTFLVVEPTVAGKTAVEQMLKKTAVARKNVQFAKNVEMALEIMKSQKPNYVFTHDKLEDGNYKELLEEHLKNHGNRLESGFILFSENDSLDAVTKLAQSEIDCLVMLPYTVTSLQSEFLKIVIPKTAPSEYTILVESAREQMRFDLDKSLQTLAKAKKADKKPYEAFYLEGLVHVKSKGLEQARTAFETSLKYHPKYYNSLKELFNIYMQLKERQKAYRISSLMTEDFPVNPEMIPDLAWVSVACAEYDDILSYHTAFKNVEEPDSDLKNYIAASLTIYGKKILKDKYEGDKEVDSDLLERAYKLMDEASSICEDKPLVYASLIQALKLSSNKQLMENVLKRAQNKFPKNKNIKVLEVIVNDEQLKPAESLKYAQDALKSGLDSPEIHEIIIKRAIELGLPERVLEESLEAAIKSFPKLKSVFESLASSNKSE
ncbi:hypothetical protein [Bacteriovorax sp. DB6_IX]|uniref:hypothetical protein n=1 Tax=Bacteriovorax sp. DB6_IX TaxID=1353530 RepID=UPI00038A1BC4|nr:hypothetical protein [Bacteriovorax sp. DB6_IX]EQC43100.1 hypothetical protein M901_2216 [Bacteriovorax sp. DB6_IX]